MSRACSPPRHPPNSRAHCARLSRACTDTASRTGKTPAWATRATSGSPTPSTPTRRRRATTGAFRATSVKVMVDGVCETFTAAMSRAYLNAPGGSGHRGDLFVAPDLLSEAVRVLDAEDFQVHVHAIGDRAITTTLDALEAIAPNRWGRNRHHIAHLQFIDPVDLGRFSRIG